MPNINKLFKQAQQMQAEMSKIQDELATQEFEGNAGGGMVKAIVNGQLKPVTVKIEKEVITTDEIEMLEDLIVAAFSDAQIKAKAALEERMSSMTGGLINPAGLGGLFN